ncbi:MAG: phosphoribosylanthranilate isomerase [Fidelibacterota bacterium]
MIPTKICGITNLSDAQAAAVHGASAIGFIFYEKSSRSISIEDAKFISRHLSNDISKVGVFVNHDKAFIEKAIRSASLNIIQLHGDETPGFCKQFEVPVLKALRIKDKASLSVMDQYNVAGFLLDTFSTKQYGGTGETFDWSLLNGKLETPIILSGGLNPDNILDAIDSVNPAAIDVNSGVEISPGKKDHQKINLLFKNLKNTNTSGFHFG